MNILTVFSVSLSWLVSSLSRPSIILSIGSDSSVNMPAGVFRYVHVSSSIRLFIALVFCFMLVFCNTSSVPDSMVVLAPTFPCNVSVKCMRNCAKEMALRLPKPLLCCR